MALIYASLQDKPSAPSEFPSPDATQPLDMTVRPTKQSLVTTVRKRLGRELTRDELMRLARAMQARQLQQRIYKPR